LELLLSRGRWNAKNLAAELETTERTVYRDLQVLEFAGVPWYFDRDEQAYRVRPGYLFPTVNLTPDELLDQAASAVVASAPAVGTGRGSRRVVQKIAKRSNDAMARVIERAQELMHCLDLKASPPEQEILRSLQWALLERRQVTGQYLSPYQATVKRVTLHPYRLCFSRQSWYIIARPSDQLAPRTYRVARFRSLRQLDRPAEIPADFNLKDYLGNAWSVFRGSQSHDVELLFDPRSAPVVTETKWHHTQQIQRRRDGSAVLQFQVDGLEEIVWWLLAWSGFVKVMQPVELRTRYVELLRKALELNERH
jgi:predicted DNA-binding transcriptional regulator YafY